MFRQSFFFCFRWSWSALIVWNPDTLLIRITKIGWIIFFYISISVFSSFIHKTTGIFHLFLLLTVNTSNRVHMSCGLTSLLDAPLSFKYFPLLQRIRSIVWIRLVDVIDRRYLRVLLLRLRLRISLHYSCYINIPLVEKYFTPFI